MSSVVATPLVRQLDRYVCGTCSYGISVVQPPARCPVCGDRAWAPDRRPARAT